MKEYCKCPNLINPNDLKLTLGMGGIKGGGGLMQPSRNQCINGT